MAIRKMKMTELHEGDIFTNEIKLRGREAFLVVSINENSISCKNRITGKLIRKSINGDVYFLRNVND